VSRFRIERNANVRCLSCGAIAPSGDERLVWLGWHESLLHRVFWWLKRSTVGGER